MTDDDISEVWEAIRRLERALDPLARRLDQLEARVSMQYGSMGTLSDSDPSVIIEVPSNTPR